MSRVTDVDRLLDQARENRLQVEEHGTKWRITNPETGGQVFLPQRAIGRGLKNFRAKLNRLGAPKSPMVAATSATPTQEEPPMAWPVPDLLAEAERQGVQVDRHGGLLRVVSPAEAEPLSRLIRDRETDVITYLTPQPTSEEDQQPMAKIRDVAHFDTPAPIVDIAADAKSLWEVIRGLARQQGEQAGTNAGEAGVIWRGAMLRVMREAFAQWSTDHRRDVSLYLERTGHARCQSRNAKPDPIWWVRGEWDDGDLTTTRTAPAGITKPKLAARPAPATGDAPVAGPTDPLSMLQAVAKRVHDAEQRAEDAELLVTELEGENERLRGERDRYKAELDQINNAFRVLAGGAS